MSPDRSRSRPTLRDVARIAAVDPSAVSRHLNGDTRLSISDTTRARIDAAVDELGYRPNLSARGLKLSRRWQLGLVVPQLSNPMYQRVAQGCWARADERGYGLVLGAGPVDQIERTVDRLFEQMEVDGLLLVSSGLDDEAVRRRVGEGRKIVVVNRRVPGVPSAVLDDATASEKATRLLLDQGHRRLGALVPPQSFDTAQRWHTGFLRAVDERPDTTSTVVRVPGSDFHAAYMAFRSLFEQAPDTTGVFVPSMIGGIGLSRAVRELGLKIPEDVSVVCLHDSDIMDYITPPLTTVNLPVERLGGAAIDLLLDSTEGEPMKELMVDGDLTVVDRGSIVPFVH